MALTHCVYCNQEITTRSKEHVIHNALGGRYESTDICCPTCNNIVSSLIDVPFTTIFNPILAQMPDMVKTANKKSAPLYKAKVSYKGKTYTATMKEGKILSCPDLNRELKCDARKLPLEIIGYEFNLQNDAFKNGISKIAFNYALAQGIDTKLLRPGLKLSKNGEHITDIKFDYPLVPFYPQNPIDAYLELQAPFSLYHNMILFSQHNNLWCYIDLFNTFQYYVLLSQNFPASANMYDSYMQYFTKMDRTLPEIELNRPKDALIYAQQYGVKPTLDKEQLTKDIHAVIASKPYVQSMEHVISERLSTVPMPYMLQSLQGPAQFVQAWQSLHLYFDDEDKFQAQNFRTLTPNNNGAQIVPYPDAIVEDLHARGPEMLRQYTGAKFARLNSALINKTR